MHTRGRKPREISVSVPIREALDFLARRPGTSQKIAQRARIVLAAAEGQRSIDIGRALGIHENTVWKWRLRWAHAGDDLQRLVSRLEPEAAPCPLRKLAAAIGQEILSDAPRSGSPPRVRC